MTVVFTGMRPCLTLVYICVIKRLINHSYKTRKTDSHVKILIEVTLGYLSAGQSVRQPFNLPIMNNRTIGRSLSQPVR